MLEIHGVRLGPLGLVGIPRHRARTGFGCLGSDYCHLQPDLQIRSVTGSNGFSPMANQRLPTRVQLQDTRNKKKKTQTGTHAWRPGRGCWVP